MTRTLPYLHSQYSGHAACRERIQAYDLALEDVFISDLDGGDLVVIDVPSRKEIKQIKLGGREKTS
jgi:hypothetical protein